MTTTATDTAHLPRPNRRQRRAATKLARGDRETPYLSPPEIARRLRVRSHKVLGWIHSGRLRAIDISSGHRRPRYRVHEADLAVYLESLVVHATPAPPRRRPQKDIDVIEYIR